MTVETFTLSRGTTPLLISCPHVGSLIPDALRPHYTDRALQSEDTDWFVERLYDFARALGASMLVPVYSRYVIDLNRSDDNAPMYPGRNNTELCPTRHFTGDPIYRDGCEPDATGIAQRINTYWQPYHAALSHELARIRSEQGHAVLLDAHSIHSELPWLFDGMLPHMSIGTADGASCAPSMTEAVMPVFAAHTAFTHVLNGRFKGGHITRHYGAPDSGVHAIQLEMAWRSYLREAPPYAWDDAHAARVAPLLHDVVGALLAWRP